MTQTWEAAAEKAGALMAAAAALYRDPPQPLYGLHGPPLLGIAALLRNAQQALRHADPPEAERDGRDILCAALGLMIETTEARWELIRDVPLAYARAFDPERLKDIENAERIWGESITQLREQLAR
ncbi:MAG: hypothetical protein ACREJS_15315 [Candidatus Rokuibacteriota bacterium]